MLNNTKRIKELYEEIQRKIFYAIPGKWDELYLYASVIERLGKLQTGEMYFYFMPKGIIKRKYINVYEVPQKYDIEEEEYLKVVDLLYKDIKELREEFIKTEQPVWSNITLSICNNKFKIVYNYDKLTGTTDEYFGHHIYWRYNNLQIEPRNKKEKQAMEYYLINRRTSKKKDEIYDTGIYLKRQTNIITFETTDFKSTQKVQYLAENDNNRKIKNQILSDKFTKL